MSRVAKLWKKTISPMPGVKVVVGPHSGSAEFAEERARESKQERFERRLAERRARRTAEHEQRKRDAALVSRALGQAAAFDPWEKVRASASEAAAQASLRQRKASRIS